jgi:hypothetical protein
MPNYAAHMPRVEEADDLRERFDAARKVTAGEMVLNEDEPLAPGQRVVVIMTPGRMLMQQLGPLPDSLPPELVANVEQIIPADPPQKITVIALNEIPALLTNFNEAIPFFGYLLGLAYVGHQVTIFEGHPSALAVGCADADLILVDGDMIPHLQADWLKVAYEDSAARRLIIFHRDGRLEETNKG